MVTNEFVSYFCLEMSLLLHAGITIEDGLYLMAEDEKNKSICQLLEAIAKKVEDGTVLSEAIRETQDFPEYVCDMLETGEKTGRMEQALQALAEYYDSRVQLARQIKNALLYPAVLFLLMMLIIVLLLVKVLPVFDKVYAQLGGRMTGGAGALLHAGQVLNQSLPFLCVFLGVVVLLGILAARQYSVRERCISLYNRCSGNRGIGKKIRTARFTQAMAMGMMSGLHTEEAFELAAMFFDDVEQAKQSYQCCLRLIEEGKELPKAMKETGLMEPFYCHILELGIKSGTADTAIAEIARRQEEEVQALIYQRVGWIEPTIVIIASMLVGTILLTVMLPLLNIMSSIG
ncbi:MAG: type II secretion system F family protein [Acetivibrio ethanolgignens]